MRIRIFYLLLSFLAAVLVSSIPCHAQSVISLTEGQITGEGISGDLKRLSIPSLAPEATRWDSPEAVVFNSKESYITIDFGALKTIRAVLVQADYNDKYHMGYSENGFQWTRIWTIPTVLDGVGFPSMGLRTRTEVLPYPVTARFLRLRVVPTQIDSASLSVSRLWAYSSVPDDWPPKLDFSIPLSRPPLFPRIDYSVNSILKSSLSTVVLSLLIWVIVSRTCREDTIARRIQKVLLWSMIIIACFAWPNFLNFKYRSLYHIHEFYHYFIGSKYTEELRYTKLYECTALAEIQNGRQKEVFARKMRDLTNSSVVPAYRIVASPNKCLSNFSQPRWEEFRSDIKWFRERFANSEAWEGVQIDHGFNASPAWMIMGTTLSNLLSTSDAYVTLLSFIDIFLLIVAGIFIYRVFGLEATFVAISFFCLNGIATYNYIGGAMLRLDWFFFLAIGFCALRKKNDLIAGFALTYAAMLRVFPGIVLAGIVLKALTEIISSRSFQPIRKYRRLMLGVVLAVVVLIPLSLIVSGRSVVWDEFIDNTSKFTNASGWQAMGLKTMLDQVNLGTALLPPLTNEENSSPAERYRRTVEQNRTAIRFIIVGAFLLLFLFAIRKEETWVVAILSLGLIPFLSGPANYYYVFLSFIGLLWSIRQAAALSLSILLYVSYIPLFIGKSYAAEYTPLSAFIIIFMIVVTGLVAFRKDKPAEFG